MREIMSTKTYNFDESVIKPPVGEINGFPYRPGYHRLNGASII